MKYLILTTVRAPYRVELFNELGKTNDVEVIFEQEIDSERSNDWYSYNNQFKEIKAATKKIRILNLDIIKQIKKSNNVDVVLLFEYSTVTSIIASQYCRLNNIPYFINCDGAFLGGNIVKKMIKTLSIKHATGCLANGESAEKYFLFYGAKQSRILKHKFTNSYNYEILNKVQSEKDMESMRQKLNIDSKFTCLIVGSFIKRKGIEDILVQWSKLDDIANLILIGSGEQKEMYYNIIKTNQFNNVRIIDFLKKNELKKYYQASDVLLFPTKEDIWGLVVNEALENGLPVIGNENSNAVLELVKNGYNGYIVDETVGNSFNLKIKCLSENPTLLEEMRNNAIKSVQEHTIENEAISINKNISELMRSRNR